MERDTNIAYALNRTHPPISELRAVKSELRAYLLAARQKWVIDQQANAALAKRIAGVLAKRMPQCAAFYWPMANEFDLRPILTKWLKDAPVRYAALPVVTELNQPMRFYRWQPNTALKKGRFQIPVPADGVEVIPDLLLIPCVGFDAACYRLGYGGGYYDRTLAALSPRPFSVGVAYECSRVDKLPHDADDIPLDLVVTENKAY